MFIKLPNPKDLLSVMQCQLQRYSKAAAVASGQRKKAIEKGDYPYFSFYGLIYNVYNFGIRNGEIDSDGSNKAAYRQVLARCHWPGGKPAVSYAENPSEKELWKSLWYAESLAYRNYQEVEISDMELLPRHMFHPSTRYDEYVNAGALAEYKHLTKPYIINFLKSAEKEIISAHPKVLGSTAGMKLSIGYSIFTDSLGNNIIQEMPRVAVSLEAEAYASDLEENKLSFRDSLGGTGGKSLIHLLRAPAMRKARRLGQKVVEFAKAKGSYKNATQETMLNSMDGVTLVMDAELAGNCVHELFKAGHMAELDRFLTEQSVAQPIVGESGIDELNIHDAADMTWPLQNGIKPLSWYKFDAEGAPNEATHIVRNGKTAEAYTSKQVIGTGQHSLEDTFGESITHEVKEMIEKGVLTGNARISSVLIENETGNYFIAEPFTRMSTLYIEPSPFEDRTLKDLKDKIRGKPNAFYCAGFVEGAVATETGQGYVVPREIYYINRYGKEIPFRKSKHQIRIIGDALSFMKKLKMIGDKSTVGFGEGDCAAESGLMPQTIISPAFLVEGAKIEAVFLGSDKSYKAPLLGPPRRTRTKEL